MENIYKEEYLRNYEYDTEKLYRKILFTYCRDEEKRINKTLHMFNLYELETLFSSFNFKSLPTARSYIQIINSFLNFCVNNHYIDFNPLETVFSTTWLKVFVSIEKYLTDVEVSTIVDKCINPQDAVIIQLLFEGVEGVNKSEIINLKITDVNVELNVLTLTDEDKSKRSLKVSERCIDLILKAHKQTLYKTKNGKGKKRIEEDIVKSEYIVKKVGIGMHIGTQTPQVVGTRVKIIGEAFNLTLNPKLIVKSGKLSLVKNIYLKHKMYNNKIKKEALEELSKNFNVPKQNNNGYLTPAHSLYTFVSLDLVNTIYGLNIEPITNKKSEDFKLVSDAYSDEETKPNNTTIRIRLKQSDFRDKMLYVYSNKCCITGESLIAVLEAAHIQAYKNEESHHPQNGLLLRTDIDKLFDKGLLTINKNYIVKINDSV
ncbi:hypothetical protein CN378_03470 [Bacillus sp. AFS015802]|uniref:phage lytic cycle repressor MrpR family protein n=1 Tax=Bacillus sp. AFS015802 TaxID=2033486 RepID=UPI000BF97B4F|nr:HNH endonuclease [Bacillus sp. AFS015802]PFA69840.1 hypothetical protein CN378_03470 [Bacillus sp. AFS015802]